MLLRFILVAFVCLLPGLGFGSQGSEKTRLLAEAEDLSKKAAALAEQQKLTEAETLDRQALEIRRKVLGDQDPITIGSMSDLAVGLSNQGKFLEAENLNRVVVAHRRKHLGDGHPLTAMSVNNLAVNWIELGKAADAEQMLMPYRKACIDAFGYHSPQHATTLNQLGLARLRLGKFAEAEAMFRQSYAIRRKGYGDDHPLTHESLNNLATALADQKQFAEAEPIMQKLLESRRKTYGPNHPIVAFSLVNVGLMRNHQLRFAEAEPLLQEALRIQRTQLGDQHPMTILCLLGLANVLAERDEFDAAEKLLRQAVELRQSALGENHPDTIWTMATLGRLLMLQGKSALAEPLLEKALKQHRSTWGDYHPRIVEDAYFLGTTLWTLKKRQQAEQLAEQAARAFATLRGQAAFSGLDRAGFDFTYSPLDLLAIVRADNGKPLEAWRALEQDLGRGLLDDLARAGAIGTLAEKQQEEQLLISLTQIERELDGHLAGKTPDQERIRQLSKDRDAVITHWTQLRSEQAKKVGADDGRVFDLRKIQKSMAPDQAFVTWIDFRFPKSRIPDDHWAVVVPSEGLPSWIRIPGSGADKSWTNADRDLTTAIRKQLQQPDDNIDVQPLLNRLRKQRVDPLLGSLEKVKHLIVLPSYDLAGIPLESFEERYRISYAPSGTIFTMLKERRPANASTNRLFALGDPVFASDPAPTASRELLQIMRGLAPRNLPCTRTEVESIAKIQNISGGTADVLLGNLAARKPIDAVDFRAFRFVHLATHGHANAKVGLNSYLSLTPENPEILAEDKLTAAEILRTWKLDADLVTLSACSTGLGQQAGGEGYVGFAQALFLAGARTLVLSQWQVNDYATSLLMVRFYQNLLGRREGLAAPMAKLAALDEARRWLRTLKHAEATRLVQALPNGQREIARWQDEPMPYAHPNYWAAFVLIGDPGQSN